MQIGRVEQDEQRAGERAAAHRSVPHRHVRAERRARQQAHPETRRRTAREHDPAVGHAVGGRGDRQRRAGPRAEAPRQEGTEKDSEENRKPLREIPAKRVRQREAEQRVGDRKRGVERVDAARRGRGGVGREFVRVRERADPAAEHFVHEVEMVLQLQVVALDERPRRLSRRGAGRVGDARNDVRRQRPEESAEKQRRKRGGGERGAEAAAAVGGGGHGGG